MMTNTEAAVRRKEIKMKFLPELVESVNILVEDNVPKNIVNYMVGKDD